MKQVPGASSYKIHSGNFCRIDVVSRVRENQTSQTILDIIMSESGWLNSSYPITTCTYDFNDSLYCFWQESSDIQMAMKYTKTVDIFDDIPVYR